MKKIYFLFCLVIFCIVVLTNVCYGYVGKHIKLDISESIGILADSNNYEEKEDTLILYFKKDPSTHIEITETKSRLNPITLNNYFKQLEEEINDSIKNKEKIKRINENNKYNNDLPNLISREIVKINNKKVFASKMNAKDGTSFGMNYRGHSLFRVFEIAIVTKNEKELTSPEIYQIVNSFQIEDDTLDYFIFILEIIGIVVAIIIVLIIIVKGSKFIKKRKYK